MSATHHPNADQRAGTDEPVPTTGPLLTPQGRAMAFLGVGSSVAGWCLGWVELMVLAAGCLLALALAIPFVIGRVRVTIVRSLETERVTVGDTARVTLQISNPTKASLGTRIIEERVAHRPVPIDVTGLRPAASHEVVLDLPTDRRGVIPIGPAVAAKSDPLGLLRREVRHVGVDQLWIHPRVVALEPVLAGASKDLDGPTSDTSPAGDVSFHALRAYEIGDDHRHVHWLSTARTGQLMVRHHVDNRQPYLTVLLDDRATSHTAEGFEVAVEIAGSLAVSSLDHRQPASLVVGDRTLLGRFTRAGRQEVLDGLALCIPRPSTTSFEPRSHLRSVMAAEIDTSVVVLVTGALNADEILHLTHGVVGSDVRIVVVRVDEETSEPVVVPSTTTITTSSLDHFRLAWKQGLT